jgi:hypothetical protein
MKVDLSCKYLHRLINRGVFFLLIIFCAHLSLMEEGRGVHRVLVGKPEGKSHWGNPDEDGRIILRWIFRKWEGVVGTGRSGLRIGTGGGHL